MNETGRPGSEQPGRPDTITCGTLFSAVSHRAEPRNRKPAGAGDRDRTQDDRPHLDVQNAGHCAGENLDGTRKSPPFTFAKPS